MVDAFSMAKIYWDNIGQRSFKDVEFLLTKLGSPKAKVYWGEVIVHLGALANGKGSLN